MTKFIVGLLIVLVLIPVIAGLVGALGTLIHGERLGQLKRRLKIGFIGPAPLNLMIVLQLFLTGIAFPLESLDCGSKESQREMNECMASTLAHETAKLNKTYRELRARMSNDQAERLKNVQLAWIKYKDLRCEFDASGVEGGTVYSYIFNLCLIDLTRQRLNELSSFFSCEEGNLSCPVK